MRARLKKIHLWISQNYEGLRFWIGLFIGIVILLVLFQQVQENRRQNTNELNEVKTVVEEVRKGVNDVNENSKKQTIILCTIILRDGLALEDDEARSVEEICEQEVRRFDAAASERTGEENTNPSSETPSSQQPAPPGSPAQPSTQNPSAPTPDNPPPEEPEPPEPPQSIIPIVDEPVIGCQTVLGQTVCL